MASGKRGLSNWGGYFNPVFTLYAIGFFLGHLHNVLLPHVRPKCLELSLHLCRWGLPIATNKNQETKIGNYIRKIWDGGGLRWANSINYYSCDDSL